MTTLHYHLFHTPYLLHDPWDSSNKRQTFVTMRCERSDTYVPPIQKLKRDDSGSRKSECMFKLHGYSKVDDTWKFNVIYSLHNHAL